MNIDSFKKLFSEIDLTSNYTLTSLHFRAFIHYYASQLEYSVSKDSNPNHFSYEKQYYNSKRSLKGPARYYALANHVFSCIRYRSKQKSEKLYRDFAQCYPNKNLTTELNKALKENFSLQTGDTAIEFTLKDINNNPVSFSSFRKKWILVTFLTPSFLKKQEIMSSFQNLHNKLPAKYFQHLIVLNNTNKINIDSLKKANHLKQAIFLKNNNWNTLGLRPYKKSDYTNCYLINPQNKIEYAVSGLPAKYKIDDFIEYILYSINQEKRNTKNDFSSLLWILLASLCIGVFFFIIYRWRMLFVRKREQQKREKLELEMQAVRSQLNPHFLFNSMNSIQHLVNADENEKANLFLSKFGNLMRKVLGQTEQSLIPLKDELETIETYLELEALRHHFSYKFDVDSNIDIYNTEIPPLLLQPFAENAVIHGINGQKDGIINVSVLKQNQSIQIQIIDNGKGENKANFHSNGKGLALTQKRIDLMMENFKNEISFHLINQSDLNPSTTGTIAQITFEIEDQPPCKP